MSKRKMFQLAISLTLLIALLGGAMGVWAEASDQEPTPEERDWEPAPFPAPPPIGTPYCDPLPVPQLGVGLDGARFTEILPWSEPLAPRGLPPAELPDGAGVKTQEGSEVPADDVEIAAISSGVQRPYRSDLNAHGRAWTRARHEPGVLTEVVVDVGLWWWDAIGATWVHVGTGFDSESQPCWRGLITAEGLARDFNASTGWYVVTSLHRVYVSGARVYSRNRQSETVWLTFP
jgi:hypothetical protein